MQIGECLPLRVPSQSSKKENIFEIFATDRDVGSSFSLLNIADNVDFTLTCACGCKVFCISTIAFYAKRMCPERLPEEHQTNVPFVRRRHLWRGVAEHATQRSGRARSR